VTFDPSTGTPATVEEAVAFWKHWGMEPWFHPDDSQDHNDGLWPQLETARCAAWELKNPWDDDMTPFWDERSRALYAAMGLPDPHDEEGEKECVVCDALGVVGEDDSPCSACNGTGVVE